MKKQKEKAIPHQVIYRSAITGRFVSLAYAIKHPKTTISQSVFKS